MRVEVAQKRTILAAIRRTRHRVIMLHNERRTIEALNEERLLGKLNTILDQVATIEGMRG